MTRPPCFKPDRATSAAQSAPMAFAHAPSPLGRILLAANQRGVCFISIGSDPRTLEQELQDRYPRQTLSAANPQCASWLAQLILQIDSPAPAVDLPLDLCGTDFQLRVWQALRLIPRGQTVSYGELARRIGAPRAIRAVASACAANTLALAIPCHRVLRADGALAGYRWGIARKGELLQREQA